MALKLIFIPGACVVGEKYFANILQEICKN
jgi:hypothetical protein